MRGVAKTKLTPDMLTLAGVSLCLAGAVLVGFEERNDFLFFWLGAVLFIVGSIADILDGALARAASKGTVFGAFLDSTFDRVGEAAMLTAIGLALMRDGNEIALVATFAARRSLPALGVVSGCALAATGVVAGLWAARELAQPAP